MTARVTETLSPALIPKQKGKLLLKHTSVTLLTSESAAVLTPITVRLLSTAKKNSKNISQNKYKTMGGTGRIWKSAFNTWHVPPCGGLNQKCWEAHARVGKIILPHCPSLSVSPFVVQTWLLVWRGKTKANNTSEMESHRRAKKLSPWSGSSLPWNNLYCFNFGGKLFVWLV